MAASILALTLIKVCPISGTTTRMTTSTMPTTSMSDKIRLNGLPSFFIFPLLSALPKSFFSIKLMGTFSTKAKAAPKRKG